MYSDEMKEKIIKDYLSTPLGEEKKQDVSKTTLYKWLSQYGYNVQTRKLLNQIECYIERDSFQEAMELCNQHLDIPLISMKREVIVHQVVCQIQSLIKRKSFLEALRLCENSLFSFSGEVVALKDEILKQLNQHRGSLFKDSFSEGFDKKDQLIKQKYLLLMEKYCSSEKLIVDKEDDQKSTIKNERAVRKC